MRFFLAFATLIYLISCDNLIKADEHNNPLDSESKIGLSIKITNLTNGSTYSRGDSITLSASNLMGSDGKNYNQFITNYRWSINDTVINTSKQQMSFILSDIGENNIELTNQSEFNDKITINVVPIFSILTISNPINASIFNYGDSVHFALSLVDTNGNSILETVPNTIEWISDKDGKIGSQSEFSVNNLRAGIHQIQLNIKLENEIDLFKTVSVEIEPIPVTIAIIKPTMNEISQYDQELIFEATFSTPGNIYMPEEISWSSSQNSTFANTLITSVQNLFYPGNHTISLKIRMPDKMLHKNLSYAAISAGILCYFLFFEEWSDISEYRTSSNNGLGGYFDMEQSKFILSYSF